MVKYYTILTKVNNSQKKVDEMLENYYRSEYANGYGRQEKECNQQ